MNTPMSASLKRVIAARATLLLDEPFFGVPALRLEVVEDSGCSTAWTNGHQLGFNPEFIQQLSAAQLKALLAHEVLHCAMGHPWRREGREQRRWNEACDRAINPVLRQSHFTLPEGALYELEPAHVGKSSEWIYTRLPQPPQSQDPRGQGQGDQGDEGQDGAGNGQKGPGPDQATQNRAGNGPGCPQDALGPEGKGSLGPNGQSSGLGQPKKKSGPEDWGEVRDAPASTPEDGPDQPPTEEDWRQLMQQAAAMARGQGRMPGGLERAMDQVTRSRLDWRSAMRRFAQERAKEDYSWTRPNPRYLPLGAYLPDLRSEGMGVVVVAVDTSGSIDQALLDQFGAELRTVADEVQPREVHVLYADSRVQHKDVFQRGEPVELHPKGGGGTDFRPVFEAVAVMDEPPVCVVYLTDLAGTFPTRDPGFPVLWVTPGPSGDAPFGEVIYADT